MRRDFQSHFRIIVSPGSTQRGFPSMECSSTWLLARITELRTAPHQEAEFLYRRLDAEPVILSVLEPLLAAEVFSRRLHRNMTDWTSYTGIADQFDFVGTWKEAPMEADKINSRWQRTAAHNVTLPPPTQQHRIQRPFSRPINQEKNDRHDLSIFGADFVQDGPETDLASSSWIENADTLGSPSSSYQRVTQFMHLLTEGKQLIVAHHVQLCAERVEIDVVPRALGGLEAKWV